MSTRRHDIARVVFAIDAAGVSPPALQVAAGLALCLQTTLAGLYVEDERLVRLAALPFSREFGLTSARASDVSPAALERGLRAQAARFREVLAALADPLSLRWTLDIVRGELHAASLASASATDLLVVSHPPYFPSVQRASEGKHWKPAALARHPVAVLLEGSDTEHRALAMARALVQFTGSDLVVLIEAADSSAFGRRHDDAARYLGPVRARYVQVPMGDWGAAIRSAAALQAVAIIRTRSDGFEPATTRRLACPIILIP